MINVGWIDYLNLFPLKVEILKRLASEMALREGHPAEVNRWLAQGDVSLAPSSSLCLLKNDDVHMALPLGVMAKGAVRSVYFGFTHDHDRLLGWLGERRVKVAELSRSLIAKNISNRVYVSELLRLTATVKPPFELAEFPPIFFTQNSASSVALGRIFLRLWLGEEFFAGLMFRALRQSQGRDGFTAGTLVELLIGDEALERKSKFAHIYDFGEMWRDLTGDPFVFAVWQTGGMLSTKVKSLMMEAAEIAERFMHLEPCRYSASLNSPLDDRGLSIDLHDYWNKLDYRITPEGQRGLIRFLSLAAAMEPGIVNFATQKKLIKWDMEGVL